MLPPGARVASVNLCPKIIEHRGRHRTLDFQHAAFGPVQAEDRHEPRPVPKPMASRNAASATLNANVTIPRPASDTPSAISIIETAMPPSKESPLSAQLGGRNCASISATAMIGTYGNGERSSDAGAKRSDAISGPSVN